MLNRPSVKSFSVEDQKAIATASAAQDGGSASGILKSYDPEHYPVFGVTPNQKVFVYVPNHVITNEDSTVSLNWDKFAAHPVRVGKSFTDIRCLSGLHSAQYGLDGSCPFCNTSNENWELYNLRLTDEARTRGIVKDEKNPEAFKEAMKDVSKKLLEDRACKQAVVWLTFPIVVIECEPGTVVPKKDEQGRLVGRPMWYQVREKTYIEKWGKALGNAIDMEGNGLQHPGGQWVILDFTVADFDKLAQRDQKMHSAKALQVTVRNMSDAYAQWAEYFDKMTEDWTPAKAQETCSLNAIRSMSEATDDANEIMRDTRDSIQLFKLGSTPNGVGIGANAVTGIAQAEDALASFGNATGVTADE